jgi:hypothetical protein
VDPRAVGRIEFTPTWSLRGGPEIVGETVPLPPPVCVAVSANGADPWLGVFHSDGSGRGTTAVIALPDRETFAVIADGDAYRVWVTEPGRWTKIAGAVTEPVVSLELQLVAFADWTTVVAYGTQGLQWESEQLTWDDLRPLRLEGSSLLIEGFDAPKNAIVPFSVDLRTGKSEDAPHPNRRLRRVDHPT